MIPGVTLDIDLARWLLGVDYPSAYAPMADAIGATTGLLCHLGTIAHQTGRELRTDSATGRILGDAAVMSRWSRTYAHDWTPSG